MTAFSIEYSGLGRVLHDLGYGQEAAEYHGTLCGMLCVHQELPDDLGLIAEYPPTIGEDEIAVALTQIADLQSESLDALRGTEMDFSPLLPSDDELLTIRVEALAQWCQGFLMGISSQPALNLDETSAELREAMEDLTQISSAQLGSEEDENSEEDDEAAYVELLEYVRAAVQLIFLELNASAPPESDEYNGATVH